MNITSYTSIDNLSFTDSYDTVKSKLEYDFEENTTEIMDIIYPVSYVEALDMVIQFSVNGSGIRFFEFFQPKMELLCGDAKVSGNYVEVLRQVREIDEDIEQDNDGFVSAKLGITVNRQLEGGLYSSKVEGLIVFSKDYFEEPEADEDDFLKFYLGYNPFDGEGEE
ncbi:hypothetical protein AMR72_11165 [Flavobacterium psychrophilum]|nr:hypothetical protein AMR72_11165 [Flavobacterium psychrophilum]AOE53023.1 hypothetical protein ALW18_11155 [Flavobacterium psychrophilum]